MMNILLPTDFSLNARNAAAYALQFFQGIPCSFHLLHVLPVPAHKVGTEFMTIPPEIQEEFDKLLDWLNSVKTNPEHKFTISFKADYLIEAVRTQVLQKNIDLILMGTKGATDKEGCIIGRNTSDVMMKVKCPVLAVSEKTAYKTPQEVLFPTDYKIPYGSKMLSTLNNLISLSKASVKVLELYSTEEEPTGEQIMNKDLLQNFFAPSVPLLQTHYRSRNGYADSIFSGNKNADMIVMAAKNLNICHKILRNHQSNQIPFINQLPLLILH